MAEISFGDRVVIRETSLTIELGIAGKVGTVMGWTTPSVTDVKVIGTSAEDRAFAVKLEGANASDWYAPELVQFLDCGSGMTIRVGNRVQERNASEEWTELPKTTSSGS